MDIIKIKAEVYQLEQQGKRLLILHYLQDVWEAKNEYSLYKALLLDIISSGLKNYRTSKQFLWQMCFYLNPEYTYYYMYGREITDDNAV